MNGDDIAVKCSKCDAWLDHKIAADVINRRIIIAVSSCPACSKKAVARKYVRPVGRYR